jgi:hypothetical protein
MDRKTWMHRGRAGASIVEGEIGPTCRHRMPDGRAMATACFAVADGRAVRLRLSAATTIACTAGMLWLTVDGDPKDHVLQPGDAVLVHDLRPLHVVVALAASMLSVTEVHGLAFIPEPWPRRARRALLAWMHRGRVCLSRSRGA